MKIDITLIQKLREETGAGVMDAKAALQQAGGDMAKAISVLRQHGQKVAAKKQERATKDGLIGYYIHPNGKVASLVSVACESDFVAKTDDFQRLAHDLAMQVAATDPQYVNPEDIPAEVIAKEKEEYQAELAAQKKPEKIWENIINGKLNKFYSVVCLMKQPFIKDDKITIEQLVRDNIMKLGENIQVKEFKKMSL